MTTGVAAPPILDIRALTCGYGSTVVLRGVTVKVAAGSVTALLGPNGAGKTTLLNAISGFVKVPNGSVFIGDHDVARLSAVHRTKLGLCHIPEWRGIFRSLSVRENLVLQSEHGTESAAIDLAAETFPILGRRLSQTAGTLSGGQQQMLSMLRAYLKSPSLVLIDEASLGLAPVAIDEIFTFLRTLAERGAALLVVDQFVTRALALADHAYVLTHGSVTFAGTAEEARSRDIFQDYVAATPREV